MIVTKFFYLLEIITLNYCVSEEVTEIAFGRASVIKDGKDGVWIIRFQGLFLMAGLTCIGILLLYLLILFINLLTMPTLWVNKLQIFAKNFLSMNLAFPNLFDDCLLLLFLLFNIFELIWLLNLSNDSLIFLNLSHVLVSHFLDLICKNFTLNHFWRVRLRDWGGHWRWRLIGVFYLVIVRV